MEKLTREQFMQLYKKLPEDLNEAVFADETENTMENIYKKYEISDKQLSQLVDAVSHVLLGILPINKFQEGLEKEIKLEKDIAKKVFFEVNRYVFFPVKRSLEEIYKTEVVSQTKPAFSLSMKPIPEIPKAPAKEKPEKPDVYREAI